MACQYVTGSRGSGKSLYGVHRIREYLERDRRVATNLDIYPDNIITGHYDLTRLPDIPTSLNFVQLGLGCEPEFLARETYDKSKFGLLVLDEISIFLNSKKDLDFKTLSAWLVQSRKYGWDLILLAQTKEQVHEEIYKALCDNLVLCYSDSLVPIPYLAGIFKLFGLKGRLPDNHTALVLGGRSEQNDVIEKVAYSYKELKNFYNTSQTFNEDIDFINGSSVDMRANIQIVPDYILSGQKLIDRFNKKIDDVKLKLAKYNEVKPMKNAHQSQGLYIKMGLLAIGVVIFMYFNNPLDNKLLSNVTGQKDTVLDTPAVSIVSPVVAAVPAVAVYQNQTIDIYDGVFERMIQGAEITIPMWRDQNGLTAIIQITTETNKAFISLDDLRVLGWYAQKVDNVFFLKKGKTTIQVPLSIMKVNNV